MIADEKPGLSRFLVEVGLTTEQRRQDGKSKRRRGRSVVEAALRPGQPPPTAHPRIVLRAHFATTFLDNAVSRIDLRETMRHTRSLSDGKLFNTPIHSL